MSKPTIKSVLFRDGPIQGFFWSDTGYLADSMLDIGSIPDLFHTKYFGFEITHYDTLKLLYSLIGLNLPLLCACVMHDESLGFPFIHFLTLQILIKSA